MSGRERASLQQRWDEYQQLPQLTEHWYWRPGWGPERRFYTWHLTFDDQPALHELVSTVQRELAVPGLDPVPLEWLHLTMQGVGFTDEVAADDIDAILQAATVRLSQLAPFDLTLGPVDPDAEGVGFLITPWDRVTEVRDAIRHAIGSVWDTVPESADGFRPHVTVAYSGAPVSTEPIRERLAKLRELPPATVKISEVPLITLRRDGRTYQWDTVKSIPLDGGAALQS